MKIREIECLERLCKLTACTNEIVEFMIEERLLDASELPNLKQEADKTRYIYNVIQMAKQKDLVLLFDFEWTLLPIERIKVTIVTTRNSKEFFFNQ